MLTTTLAIVRGGKVELLEDLALPEGVAVLVTLLPESDGSEFRTQASARSLDAIWDNSEDEVYGSLI
jgi:hypothetical protein